MKKRYLCMLALVLCLTGCGGSGSSSSSYSKDNSAGGYTDEAYSDSYSDYENTDLLEGTSGTGMQPTDVKISQEMLIYTCDMQLDVLDFEGAVADFKGKLEEFEGFVESENYEDDSSYSQYYDEAREIWHSYSAAVRIPSDRYDAFCDSVAEIGDLRSKTANAENVSQEYTDIQTTLEIYEAKEERYIGLLADASSDEYALQIESELMDIQIDIARLKTRMKQIETDVAYSTVNVTFREVKRYSEQPVKTDTFVQRLGNTVKETVQDFGTFLEYLLFMLIRMLPYILLVLLIILIVLLLVKRSSKKKKRMTPPPAYPRAQPNGNVQPNANTQPNANAQPNGNVRPDGGTPGGQS
ncbi:MAG: DUF4349 domain-containing protein [Muribaculaceae bacterium]|nr:DUF4349 domain-containing protein [Roseburia sp.]MCM1431987.1 DUF4349 domain-containing protein [Muribaculaceae bacterium]MCM1493617.1 DUF4349 domain-containing protein [Muribaculaceae bacterium]